MADYQRLIDDIQEVLASELDVDVGAGAFTGLNTQLTDAVREVNERLGKCDRLLRKGHRAEAIRQAETEPNLLVAATVLDFLEQEYWKACVVHLGLPSPPALAIDIASDLNEAYSAEQPLVRLMRDHRLRALARAPLATRINTMRKIFQLDRDSPIWEEDIRAFEKIRLNQLEAEVDEAMQLKDIPALATLEKEVRSQAWLEPPSKRLVKKTVKLHNKLRGNRARTELEAIEAKLTQAYSEFNEDLGRKLRTEWRARAVLGVLRDDDPLLERVAPALEWLEETDQQARAEEEYLAVLAELEHALDEGCTSGELERLYHAVARFETGVPDVLERRVAERARALEVTASRRGRRFLVATILVTLLAAGVTAFGIVHYLREQEVAAIIMGGRGLLEDGKLEECESYIDKMETTKPYIKDRSEFQELTGELAAAKDEEMGRKARLAQHMAAGRARGIENPRWESFQDAFAELEEAEKLCVSDAEKADVKRLHGQITNKRNEMQDEVDEAFTADLNELLGRFERLDQENMAAVDGLISEAGALGERARVTPELKNPLAPMVARLGAIREGALAADREAQFLQRVTSAVGNLETFRSELESYCEKFPGTGRANSFEKVAKTEVPLWNGVKQWKQLISQWSSQDWTRLSSAEAKASLDEVEELRADYPNFPQSAILESSLLFLGPIANRVDADKNEIHSALEEILHHWSVESVDMVETNDGKKYYFQKEPQPTRADFTFQYIPTFDPANTVRVKLAKAEIVNPPKEENFDWTSPQKLFSESALKKLAALDDGNWEITFCSILKELHHSERMDPILKLQLIEHVLGPACEGSYPLKKAFEKQVERIESAGSADDASWPDPNDDAANDAREDAARTLAQLGDIDAASAQTTQQLDQMSHPSFGASYTWLGWLCKNDGEDWTCARPGVLQGTSGELFVFHVLPGDTPAQFSKIGSVQDGRFAISASSEEVLAEGRGVFIRKTAGSAP
jgi:hypothetical protein